MAQRLPHHLFSYAEYLELESATGIRHEWLAGQVFAMAGGTPEHARLSARVVAALLTLAAPRGCEVFTSDLKVRIPATGLTTYPDASVVCGDLVRAGDDPNAITNPALVVEVLSASTESYDRGEKLWHYQQLTSVRAVVFVSQDSRRLEICQREADGSWSREVAERQGSVPVRALNGLLEIEAVYGAP